MPLELSCAVSSKEGLCAAARAGADLIFLTASGYGQVKEGFTKEELSDAVKYCRARGKKACIAFSSCACDADLLTVRETVIDTLRHGADCFSAQDTGTVSVIKKLAPGAVVYGGAKMPAHSTPDLLAAQDAALSGVMLAKELDLTQIRRICSKSGIKIFVYAHGDTCVSYDGQCFMSSALCSRSALRGECAYPCRALYSYFGDAPANHLSLKDTCLVSRISDLESAGCSYLFINAEGKRPEFAALICRLYRKALDEGKTPSRAEIFEIESVFSREGMTDGFVKGEKGVSMFGMHNEGSDRAAKKILSDARKEYVTDPEKPSLPVKIEFSAHKDEKMRLYCRDRDGNEYASSAPPALPAKKGTTKDEIREYFEKNERSVFYPEELKIDIDDGLKISFAALSALKKAAFDGLVSRRTAFEKPDTGEWRQGLLRLPRRKTPAFTMSFLKTEQITPEILDLAPEIIYLPIWRILEDGKITEIAQKRGVTLCGVLDRVIFDREWVETISALKELKKRGVSDVLCRSFGQIKLLSGLNMTLRGDYTLNVFNSQAVKELKNMSLSSCALSFDLSLERIKKISPAIDTEVLAYGRLPLLISENCLIHKRNGVHTCHTGTMTIIDKTGRSYPLLPEKGCRTALYSAEKLWLSDKAKELEKCGATFLRLSFTTENSKECLRVAKAYINKTDDAPERPTRGVYYHGAF